jgi:SOS response regulatory protein OraA/RecX
MQFDKINHIIQKEIKFPIKKHYKKAYVSLKTKLISKGFSLRIVEAALSSSSDLIKEVCLEDQLLKNEVDKMLKQYDKTDFKQKEKMISKLLQKGYDYSLIKKYLS